MKGNNYNIMHEGPPREEKKDPTLREKVQDALRERANMTPEGRENETIANLEELKIGKLKLTPEEREAHKEVERKREIYKEVERIEKNKVNPRTVNPA